MARWSESGFGRWGMLGLVAALAVGCGMGQTRPYGADRGRVRGHDFCAELESNARATATMHSVFGWGFVGLGIAASATGAILTASQAADSDTQDGWAHVGTGLALAGPLLTAGATALFSRGDAASVLGRVANEAMTQEDRAAYDVCVMAKGAWVAGKSDVNRIGRDFSAAEAAKVKADAEETARLRFSSAVLDRLLDPRDTLINPEFKLKEGARQPIKDFLRAAPVSPGSTVSSAAEKTP